MKRADGSEVNEAVYVGLCEHGKVRAIVVDEPKYRRYTAYFVAEMIQSGLTVQHVSGVEGRAALQLKCPPCEEKREPTAAISKGDK